MNETKILRAARALITPEWRCADCGCRSFAHVDELVVNRQPGQRWFAPSDTVRCVNCKRLSYWSTAIAASEARAEEGDR